jgi:subtilisin family serine protease
VVRRLIVLVAALTLMLPSAALAENPARTGAVPEMVLSEIDPQVLPNALDDSRAVTVMLEMSGDPVAVVEGEQPDDELTRAERNGIRDQLKAQQDAIRGQIAAEGGQVLSQLQFAYNGIKVTVPRDAVPALAALPNVVAVRGIQVVERDNATSLPFLNIPTEVWDPEDGLGYTGAGVKIAVIDTGIDYTHANFGGPGTVAAYQLANANDTTIGDAGDAGLFGSGAPKVMGGTDLAGDAYDGGADEGSPALIPHPDPDPLDCVFTDGSVGHGSHVSGTATGFGVLSDGTTYTGPYDSTTHDNDFEIGPGVAPEADLYFVRVFGCDGSTQLTVDAIEWAVANDMDVINMSLGSSFGRADDPSAVAATNAAAAGVSVVTSAGNSGPNPYITGSPGTATGAIATAAIDSNETFPGVVLDLTPGASINAISANGIVPPDGTTYTVKVLANIGGTPENEALGCSVGAYTANGIVAGGNQLAVTERGVCARVARGVFGQQAGAAAVAMINNAPSFPPFEGPILSNPDTGIPFEVTIPFLGVFGPANSADANALRLATSASTTATTLTNPGFTGFASFSSGGPRSGDSALKPDIAAPGVSILSTASGTGNKGYVLSGTSMASPHVAGIAALVRQAHPDWTTEEVKAAIVNSGDPGAMAGYRTTRAGSGLVNAAAAIGNDVVALGSKVKPDGSLDLEGFHNANLSFGFAELGKDFNESQAITIRNHGTTSVTLALGWNASGFSAPANVSFNKASVTIRPGGEANVRVTLRVAASAIPPSSGPATQHEFHEVSGNVTLTGGGMVLRVPYLLVPRSLSDIGTKAQGLDGDNTEATATVTNKNGAISGIADFYTWGLEDRDDVDEQVVGGAGYDVRAVGVQSFPLGATNQLLVFAINNYDRWSNAAVNEFDININNDADAFPEFTVIAFDSGAIRANSFNGLLEVFLADNTTNQLFIINSFAISPTDSSTLLMQIPASFLGLTQADGSFTYDVVSFSLEGPGQDVVDGVAAYNPWDKALEDGQFVSVDRGASVAVPIAIDPVAFDQQDPLGIMVVGIDDKAGKPEADLVKARR